MKKLAILLITLVTLSLTLIHPSKANAACTAPTTDYGSATQTLNVPATGDYRVWSRIMAPNATANSYLLEIDGGSCFKVGDSTAIQTNTWTWVNYQDGNTSSVITLTGLAAGNHTFKMIGREAGVKLDRIILTADTACFPTGTGDNCIDTTDITPPTVSITAPTSGKTLAGTVTMSANANDNVGIKKVEFYVGNTLHTTELSAPYSYAIDTTQYPNGPTTLTAKAYDTSDIVTNSSISVTIDNPPVGQADLVITSVTLTPSNPLPGEQTLFKAVVKNQGNAATTLGVKHGAKFQIDGTTVSWHSNDITSSIPAGGTYTFDANDGPTGSPYWSATEGSHTLTAYVDDLQLIAESDDSNNTLTKTVTVNPPPDTIAPTVPNGGSAVATSATSAKVTWTASTDNVGVTGYWISRNGVTIAQVGTSLSYTDNNVEPSTLYTYQVAAFDAADNTSAFSTASSVTTPKAPDTIAPSAPTVLYAITLSSTQINLSWTASTDNIGVTGYDIYRSVSSGPPAKIATVTTTSYGNGGLTPETTYTYYVVARDAAGLQSNKSSVAPATTYAAATKGNIYGTVNTSTGPLRGATIRVYVNGKRITSKTNASGAYLITTILAGNYTFSYSASGYTTRQVTFTIYPDKTTPGNVTLVKL